MEGEEIVSMTVKIIFVPENRVENIEIKGNRVRDVLKYCDFLEDEVLLIDRLSGKILTPYDFLTAGAEIEIRRVYSVG